MCLEDIRLGRKLKSRIKFVTCPAGQTTRIVGNDATRTRLIVSGDGTNDCHLTPDELTPTASSGWALTTQDPHEIFQVEQYGPLVQSSWLAHPGAVQQILMVIESSLSET